MIDMVIAAQDSCDGAAAQFRASGLPPGNSAAVPLPEGLQSPGRQVGVTRLVLTDFRNYRSARLDLDAGPVVLTGPNGAGKTNLLEAVSFLSPGRGLRNARLGEIDRRNPSNSLSATDGEGRVRGPATGEPVAAGWAVAATIMT